MDVDALLTRIGYNGSREPTLESLEGLHRAFLLAVPFENLDIHIGRTISLDPDAIFEKIVTRRRGGFCYECNGLFAELLSALGYSVERLSARMALSGNIGPEFDHMVLLGPQAILTVDLPSTESQSSPFGAVYPILADVSDLA